MTLEIVIEHLGASSLVGRSQSLRKPRIRIGRRPDNDVAFDPHADRLVSGYHAELEVEGERVRVKDLGSNNGVLVNGTKVSGLCPLQSGDELALGPDGPRMKITYQPAGAAAPSDQPAKQGIGEATLQRTLQQATASERQRTRALLGVVVGLLVLVGGGVAFSIYRSSLEIKQTVDEAKQDVELAKQDADRAKQDAAKAGETAAKADESARKAQEAAEEASRKAAELQKATEQATKDVLRRHEQELAALKGKIGKEESRIARLIVEIQQRDRSLQELKRRQDLSQEERKKLLDETKTKLEALRKKLSESEQAVRGGGGGGPDWAGLVTRYQHAMFLCYWADPEKNMSAIGTAFSVRADGLLATNAHVAKGMQEWPVKLCVQNETGRVFKVKRIRPHPGFRNAQSPDVGLVQLENEGQRFPVLPLASDEQLRQLRIGTHLGTLGYPGELQDVYLSSIDRRTRRVKTALATFKDGWIGRMTNFRLERDEFPRQQFLQHSASLSGGTSGSPMFTADGTVVALNNSGLDLYVLVKEGEQTGVKRSANAAEIGYAIRVDLLRALIQETGW